MLCKSLHHAAYRRKDTRQTVGLPAFLEAPNAPGDMKATTAA